MDAPVKNEDLIYAVDDGIARLTFNRPQARNALTFAMYEQMAAICETVNADRSIKAMILTGTGVIPRRRAQPSQPGAWKSGARTRALIRTH